eukprot:9121949-Heterocapsa_arctica.AAC.1
MQRGESRVGLGGGPRARRGPQRRRHPQGRGAPCHGFGARRPARGVSSTKGQLAAQDTYTFVAATRVTCADAGNRCERGKLKTAGEN